jgi:hypothetical protein
MRRTTWTIDTDTVAGAWVIRRNGEWWAIRWTHRDAVDAVRNFRHLEREGLATWA